MRRNITISILACTACLAAVILASFSPPTLTGPSILEAEIHPISINDQGEVLCKTRFTQNKMGGYRFHPIEYGYCIISADRILQLAYHTIDPSEKFDYDSLYSVVAQWDSIFQSDARWESVFLSGSRFERKFRFDGSSVEKFRKDSVVSVRGLVEQGRLDSARLSQNALNGGRSLDHERVDELHVSYDFGYFLLTRNSLDLDNEKDEEVKVGVEFDYYNPWVNEDGVEVNIGFDLYEVTGVLYLDLQ